MGLEFHLTHYERCRKEGIAAYKSGDAQKARTRLLQAAEHLFKVAAASEGRLKSERAQRATELVRMAKGIRHGAGKSARATAGGGREGDVDSEDSGDRFLVGERPKIRFSSIAGLEDVKEEIRLKIIYPYLHPERARKYGIEPGGGILFYGPPGTGKTMLARAIAAEVDCAFFTVKPSEILSKWVGDAEKNLASLFQAARERERAVIFIDEIEALAPRRSENRSSVMARLVPQILAELEGFSGRRSGMLFLGATNEPWGLDTAILRPGRFDEQIYVGLPDAPAIEKLLSLNLDGRPLAEDVDLLRLAQLLSGYSGADVRNVCRKAADAVFLESIRSNEDGFIDQLTLLDIIHDTKASVSEEALRRFEEYRRTHG